jgi:hypothetical protein
MAISGIGSNYSNVYGSTYTAQKNEAVKKTETKEAAPAQSKNTEGEKGAETRRGKEKRAEGTGRRTSGKDSDFSTVSVRDIGCVP